MKGKAKKEKKEYKGGGEGEKEKGRTETNLMGVKYIFPQSVLGEKISFLKRI